MADQRAANELTELRMNLAAIKRVDPYAKSIVESSAHVAFYTFNSNDTEWEKTDVEGAFFIYSRNAEPFFSIFINNRLNTNSLLEPISGQLELQSQPPFLLYRNERSRIRGFWFYNKTECDRIGELVDRLIKDSEKNQKNANVPPGLPITTGVSGGALSNKKQSQQQSLADIMSARPTNTTNTTAPQTMVNKSGVDIFTMLTKAQEDFNNAQVVPGSGVGVPTPSKTDAKTPQHHQQQQQVQAVPGNNQQQPDVTSQSVMNFFAAAKPATAKEVPFFQRMLSNPVHVDQIEKQHRTVTPQEKQSPQQSILQPQQVQRQPQSQQKQQAPNTVGLQSNENGFGFMRITSPNHSATNHHELGTSPLASFINTANLSGMARTSGGKLASGATNVSELEFRQQPLSQLLKKSEASTTPGKPALMPPTMFTSGVHPQSAPTASLPSTTGGNLVSQLQQQQPVQKVVLAPPPGIQPLHIIHREALKQQQASTPIAMHMVGNQWLPMAPKTDTVLQQQEPPESLSINRQPEPLTQSQLLQAMSYLIKNDPDFVRKLHEAYLKSFTEMVSL